MVDGDVGFGGSGKRQEGEAEVKRWERNALVLALSATVLYTLSPGVLLLWYLCLVRPRWQPGASVGLLNAFG